MSTATPKNALPKWVGDYMVDLSIHGALDGYKAGWQDGYRTALADAHAAAAEEWADVAHVTSNVASDRSRTWTSAPGHPARRPLNSYRHEPTPAELERLARNADAIAAWEQEATG